MLSSILLAAHFSSAAKSEQCDISGVWDHSAKPATLSVDLSKGEISVKTHELNAKAVGLVVMKSLELAAGTNSWKAEMYNAADDSFVDVKISALSCNQLSISLKGEEFLSLLRKP